MSKRMSVLKSRILLTLQRDRTTSLRELAELTEAYPSSISRCIKSLREEGLVDNEDYILTDTGEEVKEKIAIEFTEKLKEITSPISSYLTSYANKIAQGSSIIETIIEPGINTIINASHHISQTIQPLMETIMVQNSIIEKSMSWEKSKIYIYNILGNVSFFSFLDRVDKI